LKNIDDPLLEKRLLQLDEAGSSMKYKVGVLLCAPGQKTDDEFFCNVNGSLGFEKFLMCLGDKVELKGFKGFTGGLDTRDNLTGTHSIYTKWRNFEVMFHVSTMIPFTPGDTQQVARKKHLGNDIVMIVYLDGDVEFDPTSIRTQFTLVFIVIKEESIFVDGKQVDGYRIALTTNIDVPKFLPTLPNPSLFYDRNEIHEFLLSKIINGENAAYKAPRFAKPAARTQRALFEDIVEEF
ncbi:hypothetical protein EDD86DRAFT_182723, partial [Gorgonomyces haynaldii]